VETITDYSELRDRVRYLTRPAIVAVEGFVGSGKSHLASALARDVPASVVHIDEYVIGENESLPYPDRLDYNRILAAVESAHSASRVLVIDGICLRESLRRLRVSANYFVYVKRIAQNGLWHDGFHLEDFETKSVIKENREEPHVSDFSYHSAVRPHEMADVVFHRVEAD